MIRTYQEMLQTWEKFDKKYELSKEQILEIIEK